MHQYSNLLIMFLDEFHNNNGSFKLRGNELNFTYTYAKANVAVL